MTLLKKMRTLFDALTKNEKPVTIEIASEKTTNEVLEKMKAFEESALNSRLDKIEKIQQHILVRLNQINKQQQALGEVFVTNLTALEEISHELETLNASHNFDINEDVGRDGPQLYALQHQEPKKKDQN